LLGVPGGRAAFGGDGFQEILVAVIYPSRDLKLGAKPGDDLSGGVVADVGGESRAPIQESFHEREIFGWEAVRAQLGAVTGNGGVPDRLDVLEGLFVNDHGCGDQVAQALAIFGQEHGDNAEGVEERKLIHDAEQVAAHGFYGVDRPAIVFDHANADDALSRSLPIPNSFEDDEVAVEDEEKEQEHDRAKPRPRSPGEMQSSRGERGDEHDQANEGELDQRVNRERQKTTAYSSNGELERGLFGSFDGKLIGQWRGRQVRRQRSHDLHTLA
jgi:hypothetical protein